MQKKNQKGNLIMVLVPILAVIVIIGIGGLWLIMSHKKTPTTTTQSTVSADDALTSGNSNQNLNQDVRILSSGVSGDGSYLSSTNAALNDQPQSVLND